MLQNQTYVKVTTMDVFNKTILRLLLPKPPSQSTRSQTFEELRYLTTLAEQLETLILSETEA